MIASPLRPCDKQVGGLCVAGDYAELAKRFVGFVPEDRPETLLGVTATKRAEIPAIPTCPLPQPEVEALLKARPRPLSPRPRPPPPTPTHTLPTSPARSADPHRLDPHPTSRVACPARRRRASATAGTARAPPRRLPPPPRKRRPPEP
jgi:hypothetical protein